METLLLFRIQVLDRSPQRDLFLEELTRSDAIKKAVWERPQSELRAGSVWRIGNVKDVDDTGIYFCVGRTARSRLSKYEGDSFVTEPITEEPFVHVLIDLQHQVAGISRNWKLGAPKQVAAAISALLSGGQAAKNLSIVFVIDQINDPTDFIAKVTSSYAVTYLRVQFRPPNLMDVTKFLKASGDALDEIRGDNGYGTFYGESLDKESVVENAQTAARTGREISVRVREAEGSPTTPVALKDNPIVIERDGVDWDNDDAKRQLIGDLLGAYSRVARWEL